jgi:hypothetical protein
VSGCLLMAGAAIGEEKMGRAFGDGRRRDDREVLIVVDVQNDFCPEGALAVPDGDAVVPAINRLAEQFAHVVLTQDWHPLGHSSFAGSHPGRRPFETIEMADGAQTLWPEHCVQETTGASFHPALAVPHAELVLRKGFRREIDSYSAFRENDRRTPGDGRSRRAAKPLISAATVAAAASDARPGRSARAASAGRR